MNGRHIGAILMFSSLCVVFWLFVVRYRRAMCRLRSGRLLEVISLGPEERRRFLWLDLRRRHGNFRWMGFLGAGVGGWLLCRAFLNEMGVLPWLQANAGVDAYLIDAGLGGLLVWWVLVSAFAVRAWSVKDVAVYSAGVLVGGQPRAWADLKHVVFDELSSELRFYDECADGEGSKFFDVHRIPIAKGQRIQVHRIIESLARVANSDAPVI